MKVIFVSRNAIETCAGWPGWALISMSDPHSAFGQPKIMVGWSHVLRMEFHDVTPKTDGVENYVLPTREDATRIVEFVRQVGPGVEGFVVQCNAGVSRSAAVAKWIAGEHRIAFNRSYDKFNQHLYELLIAAGKEKP